MQDLGSGSVSRLGWLELSCSWTGFYTLSFPSEGVLLQAGPVCIRQGKVCQLACQVDGILP